MRARTWIVLGLVILWASPGGAAPRCSREARDACQAERYRCERDCPDLDRLRAALSRGPAGMPR